MMFSYKGPFDEDVESGSNSIPVNVIDSGLNNEDLVNEEPTSEPEPEFDPEAVVSYSRFGRKKKIIFGAVLLCSIIGVGLSFVPWRKNSSSQSNASAVTETSEDYAVSGSQEKTKSVESNVESASVDMDLGDYIDVRKGFLVDLKPFTEDVLAGYSTCSELLKSVEESAKYLSNVIIQNKGSPQFTVMAAQSTPNADNIDSYETNNQVDGVDEADVVKSDGNVVYLAYGNELVVVSVDGTVLSRTPMPQIDYDFPMAGYWQPDSVLEEEDDMDVREKVKARSSAKPQFFSPTQSIRSILLHEGRLAVVVEGYQYSTSLFFLSGGMTTVVVYDVNNDGTLSLVDKKTVRGLYREARSIGSRVHLVTNSDINSSLLASYLRFWMFPNELSDLEYKQKAYARAQKLVPQFARQVLAELLGNKHDGSVGDYQCQRIVRLSLMRTGSDSDDQSIPDLTGGSGVLNNYVQTTSFDLFSNKVSLSQSVTGAFLPTSLMNMYASKDMLILSAQGWKKNDDWKEYTYLMGFDISSHTATPVAVGEVPGYLLNQYSLDYNNGFLRAASTTNSKWGLVDGEWVVQQESESQINVMQKVGSKFVVVGEVSNLAPGERIYSVRFMQDKAFVGTFRQIDPFFTFDLSSPSNPKKLGELKIPGFSNYLHPTQDENYILAVGQDANETTGRPMGLQISIFNTTDMENPTQAHKLTVQSSGGSASVAQYDPHAFRYIEQNKILILPVYKYSFNFNPDASTDDDNYDGFRIYKIDEYEGITEIGEVLHADSDLIARSCFSWSYIPARSMIFQGNLMTFKGHTIVMTQNIGQSNTSDWILDLDEDRSSTDVSGCMPWFV